MLALRRSDRHAFTLNFDPDGALRLRAALEKALFADRIELAIAAAPELAPDGTLRLAFHDEGEPEILLGDRAGRRFELHFERDTALYGLHLLSRYFALGDVFPAEWCQPAFKGREATLYLIP